MILQAVQVPVFELQLSNQASHIVLQMLSNIRKRATRLFTCRKPFAEGSSRTLLHVLSNFISTQNHDLMETKFLKVHQFEPFFF